jgi:D-inositol-3-phosphate glycosyltransferase
MSEIREQRSEVRGQSSALNALPSARPSSHRGVAPSGPEAVLGPPTLSVALLTGGDDKPYALGLATALTSGGILVDFIGSDDLAVPELLNNSRVNFLNLRRDQRENVSFGKKFRRILAYYGRLVRYAAAAKPRIFHILWNNKFELVDRILLMLYYRLLGKKIVFTAHNVNAAERDSTDSLVNRVSLRIQYCLTDHMFVHGERMKGELLTDFGVPESKTTVIPFGINNTSPATTITTNEAKERLGVNTGDKTALFFGQIAPYKGLEFLVEALVKLSGNKREFRLIIAGRVKKGCAGYWGEIQRQIEGCGIQTWIIERIEHIPDEEVELYFKAADVLIIPYTRIFQSGVPFLAYSFGLPVIATDVGSLRQDIVEGKTGFVCRPKDSSDLARTIGKYFRSELFRRLESRRTEIKEYANERYSWDKVAAITMGVYSNLLKT